MSFSILNNQYTVSILLLPLPLLLLLSYLTYSLIQYRSHRDRKTDITGLLKITDKRSILAIKMKIATFRLTLPFVLMVRYFDDFDEKNHLQIRQNRIKHFDKS